MDTRQKRTVARIAIALFMAAGLAGCVYAPPYAAYDSYVYYPAYSYPTYVGPPIGLNFDFGYHKHSHGYYGHHGYHGGYRHYGGWGRGRR
jgi:hypothetical protein